MIVGTPAWGQSGSIPSTITTTTDETGRKIYVNGEEAGEGSRVEVGGGRAKFAGLLERDGASFQASSDERGGDAGGAFGGFGSA